MKTPIRLRPDCCVASRRHLGFCTTGLPEVRASREVKYQTEQRFQESSRSCSSDRGATADERAAYDIGHVVLTGEYTGESDERREDESGHANALRNQEQRHRDREGERGMVAGKRRIVRRPKQERRGLDSEWTWSAPDQNDDLVQEQRARGRNDGDEDKSLAAFTLCSCSAEKPNKCQRDIQQVGAKSAESDRQHIDESLLACQPIDGREEVVIHLESLTSLRPETCGIPGSARCRWPKVETHANHDCDRASR